MSKMRTRRATSSARKKQSRPVRKNAPRALSPRPDGEIHPKGMSIGYARVSTLDQNLALQFDALIEAGCAKIFTEQVSGAVANRPSLSDALAYARSGDTLVVWKLDCWRVDDAVD